MKDQRSSSGTKDPIVVCNRPVPAGCSLRTRLGTTPRHRLDRYVRVRVDAAAAARREGRPHRAALEAAFRDVDVVVHLAFMITGNARRETIREINVEGTANTFRVAARVNAKRFVHVSSVAAYGFHADNPVGMSEEWPTRPAKRFFYAQQKAELEQLLNDEASAHPGLGLYLLRPPVVLGPHVVGAKAFLPGPLSRVGARLAAGVLPLRFPLPVLVPGLSLQFIHEDDVGQALVLCVVGAGPPGAYNIAGDGVMTGVDIARELGLAAVPIPGGLVRAAARTITRLPLPPQAEWLEAATQPAIMDTTKARRELGWQPRYTSTQALRDTIQHLTRRPAPSSQPRDASPNDNGRNLRSVHQPNRLGLSRLRVITVVRLRSPPVAWVRSTVLPWSPR
jgi:nucleoside-diphosphate-sugar epimerase